MEDISVILGLFLMLIITILFGLPKILVYMNGFVFVFGTVLVLRDYYLKK